MDQFESLKVNFFSPLPYYPLSSCQIFLPLISAPTGFHVSDLVTKWAELLITSNYYLPNTLKDCSTIRAELTGVIESQMVYHRFVKIEQCGTKQ